MTVRNCNNN